MKPLGKSGICPAVAVTSGHRLASLFLGCAPTGNSSEHE